MPRFLLPPADWNAPQPALTGDEARHLAQVLRIRAGQQITVFDGAGRRAPAAVLDVARDHVSLALGAAESPAAPLPRITLAQAIPKGKTMDSLVRKAVELGVAAIDPLVTRNTIVQPGDRKAGKWQRTALEACKQCGQDTLPAIAEPTPFATWLAALPAIPAPGELRIIASLAPGARPLREILPRHPGTTAATLLIGPEGDFSSEETTAALAAGFLPATLGHIVLRVETAATFCLSALRYQFG